MTLTTDPHRTIMADQLLAFYNSETQPMPSIASPGDAIVAQRSPLKAHPGKEGKIGWALLWLMGIPIPLLILLFFMRGCT